MLSTQKKIGERTLSVNASQTFLLGELNLIRLLLDDGHTTEVQKRLKGFIKLVRNEPSLLAKAHYFLSVSFEMQGQYEESLEAIAKYESALNLAKLDRETQTQVNVQIAIAYNYTGNNPKAIALLKTALQDSLNRSNNTGDTTDVGIIYNALARVYRSINEYTIARDYSQKALEHFRQIGNWRGLAESYFGVALTELFEGKYEPALECFEQAIRLIGERPAAHLLGHIYTAMAGAYWFLKRPHEGIACLEKAVGYYERIGQSLNLVGSYNNLGINLILVGEWDRAQKALERALELYSKVEETGTRATMLLDSLGELHLLRGNLKESQQLLERAVAITKQNSNKWYAWQPLRTLGRCYLALKDPERAIESGEQALAFGEHIGDRQAICESLVLLVEAYLSKGDLAASEKRLQEINAATKNSQSDIAIVGDVQRVFCMLEINKRNFTQAAYHAGRSVSIFEMLGDSYRCALAHYWLGCALASTSTRRATEHLSKAAESFRKLGAHKNLEQTQQALNSLELTASNKEDLQNTVRLNTLRLTEATLSRELLLHELANILKLEIDAGRVLITESSEAGNEKVVVSLGWNRTECEKITAKVSKAVNGKDKAELSRQLKINIISLTPKSALPATLIVGPSVSDSIFTDAAVDSLLKVAEMGLDICAFSEKAKAEPTRQKFSSSKNESLLPGFIHTSPAMMRVIEEIQKIRSSNVTVLITGESGTGKELVARAIHALSSRRDKVFLPFNCTAVPKELSESYLFGFRKGSFTGAVADSTGIIRSATGGTLFLDEIGDLPPDIQPKLLRFLQEGEIQVVGEQKPIKTDVRIIAATNTELEKQIAAGRFREDLYYRLNVIRLQVPPLRERRSEIPALINHYLNLYSEQFRRKNISIHTRALDLMMSYDWPGNIRQLCNEVQKLVAYSEDGFTIEPKHLSQGIIETATVEKNTFADISFHGISSSNNYLNMKLPEAIEKLEHELISTTLQKNNGNISRTARDLGITRRGLQLKLARNK